MQLNANTKIVELLSNRVQDCLDEVLLDEASAFTDLSAIERSIDEVLEFESLTSNFLHVVVVGMGGSSLGAKVLMNSIPTETVVRDFTFLDNVDADSVSRLLKGIQNFSTTAWVVVSKSGNTFETLATYKSCTALVKIFSGFDITDTTFVVCGAKGSELDRFACELRLPRLRIPVGIGGRFSVFTPAALLPFVLAGGNTTNVIAGCREAFANLDPVIKVASQLIASINRDEGLLYLFAYGDKLSYFSQWLRQLWSESLGKKLTSHGTLARSMPTLIPCRGTSDQHSVLQQIIEGPELKFVVFVRDLSLESSSKGAYPGGSHDEVHPLSALRGLMAIQSEATQLSVDENGIRSLSLMLNGLGEKEISRAMMSMMLTVATIARYFEIDAFGQPGVERGKHLTGELLGARPIADRVKLLT